MTTNNNNSNSISMNRDNIPVLVTKFNGQISVNLLDQTELDHSIFLTEYLSSLTDAFNAADKSAITVHDDGSSSISWSLPGTIALDFHHIGNTLTNVISTYPSSEVVDLFHTLSTDLNSREADSLHETKVESLKQGIMHLYQMADSSAELILFIPPVMFGDLTRRDNNSYFMSSDNYFNGYWPEIVGQITRVLKPGGRCIICGCFIPKIATLPNILRTEIDFINGSCPLLSIAEKPVNTN